MALRWGIVSAGKISSDFVSALTTLPPADHKVVAVAARDLSRAKEFAAKFKIPKYYSKYEEIAADKDIDVVYIGCLNPQHYEVIMMMLQARKHVLCEKPLTMNLKQTAAVVKCARENKVFLQEAVWSRCFPVYKELRKQLDAGVIGEVKQVDVSFGFELSNIERVQQKELGGGTILDLGVYTLQLQQFVFGNKKPSKIYALGELSEEGTDIAVNAVLKYPRGQFASLQTSGVVRLPNEAVIVGTKGIIVVPHFWSPTKLVLPNETKEFALPETNMKFNFENSVGLSYEAEEVRQCILQGKIENPAISLDESLQLAELMDTLRQQVGVHFPADD